MLKTILVLLLVVLQLCNAVPEPQIRKLMFTEFMLKHGKKYANQNEFQNRFGHFENSLRRIEMMRLRDPTADYGITKYSDWSPEEFHSILLMPQKSGKHISRGCLAFGNEAPRLKLPYIPEQFDWREYKKVTPVKNQEACGSCWAFSSIGAIESQYAIQGNELTSFSEQELVDCSHDCWDVEGESSCNSGCQGGWQWTAYRDIIDWGGVMKMQDYPYRGNEQTCRLDASKLFAPISNFTCLSGPDPADENQMAAYIVAHGPLSAALNAQNLQDYSGGVIHPHLPWFCNADALNHAILIVGFGKTSDGIEYWIIKNSWGDDWGESGYFRMAKGNGTCGINHAVSAPIL